MSLSAPTPAPVILPGAPAAPPMLGSPTQGSKPQAKASQPTFLGSNLVPQAGQTGQKTLLGQ